MASHNSFLFVYKLNMDYEDSGTLAMESKVKYVCTLDFMSTDV